MVASPRADTVWSVGSGELVGQGEGDLRGGHLAFRVHHATRVPGLIGAGTHAGIGYLWFGCSHGREMLCPITCALECFAHD
jgi:hypothetical protein